MKRNKNVEILRSSAILYVMLYHFFVISGKSVPGTLMPTLLSMGGELGVTMFFVISGFGVYMLLDAKNQNYRDFLTGRIKKLTPEYYLCLVFLLLFTNQSVFLNKDYIWNVVSHFLYLHSLSPSYSGAINGALWTMGVLMQFYVLAYGMYRLQKKTLAWPFLLILISLAVKGVLYHVILPAQGITDAIYFFIYGRQIYSALDNFIVGMLVAELIRRDKLLKGIKPVVLAVVTAILLGGWAYKGFYSGIYADNLFSYIWHFVCALLCGSLVYAFYAMPEIKGTFVKPFHWVAKYSYGIYLWHLVLGNNILLYCTWAQQANYPVFALVLTGLSCVMGYISFRCGQALAFTKKLNISAADSKEPV